MAESQYFLSGHPLPAFELALESALADFFAAAYAVTGGPLTFTDGSGNQRSTRVLAAVRDYEKSANAADPSPDQPDQYRSAQDAKVPLNWAPDITFRGGNYQRMQGRGLDECDLDIIISVNLKQQTTAIFSQLLSHTRNVFSAANISAFCDAFNSWSTAIGSSGYKLFLQGLTQPQPHVGPGFDDKNVNAILKYHATGGFQPA